MASRPGRRASKLEFVVSLSVVAALAGWWMMQFSQAQADVRLLRVRDTAAMMRALSLQVHLLAQVQQMGQHSGSFPTEYGPVDLEHGYPRASAAGIGKLLQEQMAARSISCGPVPVADLVNQGRWVDAYECAPTELPPAARGSCAARYMPPAAPGIEPGVTFLFHSRRQADMAPCVMP